MQMYVYQKTNMVLSVTPHEVVMTDQSAEWLADHVDIPKLVVFILLAVAESRCLQEDSTLFDTHY
jgi:hypothetical protein